MRALYTFVLAVGLVAMTPVFAAKAVRHRKYLGSLRARFGGAEIGPDERPTLWVHAVSVGEVLAAEPLVRAAARALPDWRFVVSTTTATGQRLARSRFPELDVIYFPLDLPGAVGRVLDRVRPTAVCVVETEIWPNFLAACRERGVPVALVNGRFSDRSFGRYRRAGSLLRPVLDDVALFLMQSEADAERVRRLGAPADRVHVVGNLKYDVDRGALEATLAPRRAEVDRAFRLPDPRPLVVVGSTTDGEEKSVAEAMLALRAREGFERARVLVAPRHPERFAEAERAMESSGLRVVRRSQAEDGAADPAAADCLLLDSIGELAAVYARADVVFVGGSLVPRGGHNILEPALYARPIVVGPHTENFRQIVGEFVAADAVVQLPASAGNGAGLLARAIGDLLADPAKARAMGERGLAVLEANRGATGRTLERVLALVRAR